MAIKIFISSVSQEFVEERNALKEEIIALQDLFIGMEFFGSDSQSPIELCKSQVKSSDLYIGIVGRDIGSLESTAGLPFTQLEYLTAQESHKPVLIYLANRCFDAGKKLDGKIEPIQKIFIEDLRRNHVVQQFDNPTSLRLQFLKDFIRQLRTGLFSDHMNENSGLLPSRLFHRITQAIIDERIRTVGQEKYIREIYTRRNAENQIDEFILFDQIFLTETAEILKKLFAAATSWPFFDEATSAIDNIRKALQQRTTEEFDILLLRLKKVFDFDRIAGLKAELDLILQLRSTAQIDTRLINLVRQLVQSEYIKSRGVAEDFTETIKKAHAVGQPIVIGTNSYELLVQMFPAFRNETDKTQLYLQLTNDLLLELTAKIDAYMKKCIILVDKAGSGKTNIACHLAESLVIKHPTILLDGQSLFNKESNIELHIQRLLEAQMGGIFVDWLVRADRSLRSDGQWFYIIIDAINEYYDRPGMISMLRNFLPKIRYRNIKIVLTCRDLFWEPFKQVLHPYLFKAPISVANFSSSEWKDAINLYFKKYHIICALGPKAVQSLKNPLLLRFFCEANQGLALEKVHDIKLLKIFDNYLDVVNRNIVNSLPNEQTNAVTKMLISVLNLMWDKEVMMIDKADLDSLLTSRAFDLTLYQHILNENIIIEEQVHIYASCSSVKFLYDEFMEYMLARTLFDRIHSGQLGISELLAKSIEVWDRFPAIFGALFFLDQILGTDINIVNQFIKYCFKINKLPGQAQLVYVFKKIDPQKIDEEIISAFEKFHEFVSEDHKNELAEATLRILPYIPNHNFAKNYVKEILEIQIPEEIDTNQSKHATYKIKSDDDVVPALPPARFHYSDEAKLSAIILLVDQKEMVYEDFILEGIERAGRSDVNMALNALRHLEYVEDRLLFKILDIYVRRSLTEYRLLSAWLLRRRYGKRPAEFLFSLLTDDDARVHEYVFRLFETREIELELIIILVEACNKAEEIKIWHLSYIIKLLGHKEKFRIEAVEYYTMICSILDPLQRHPKTTIRLEAFRSSLSYPEIFDKPTLIARMKKDHDRIVVQETNRLAQ